MEYPKTTKNDTAVINSNQPLAIPKGNTSTPAIQSSANTKKKKAIAVESIAKEVSSPVVVERKKVIKSVDTTSSIPKPLDIFNDQCEFTRRGFVWSFWDTNKSIIPVTLSEEIEQLLGSPLSHDYRVLLAESFNSVCMKAFDSDESIEELKASIMSAMFRIQGNILRNCELLQPSFGK